ncbi:MAG: hypothetical protein K6G16_02895 [Lachnospiraceae bacterium]|nr:hypothetical protein [Lachnospiraceae bacterium]
MLKVIMISAILSAIVALVAEIICTEQKAKAFWLGASTLYFLISSGAFWFCWKDGLEGAVAKQIIVFLVIVLVSFLCAVLIASVVISVLKKWEEDELAKIGEKPEDKKDAENDEKE